MPATGTGGSAGSSGGAATGGGGTSSGGTATGGGGTSSGGTATGGGGTTTGGTSSGGSATGGSGGSGGACAMPGGAVTGKANDHCSSDAGAMITQAIGMCMMASADGGMMMMSDGGIGSVLGGDYGDTNYGTDAFDDDCKYHVMWTSTPVCENTNVTFTVMATYLAHTDSDAPVQHKAGDPLPGAAPYLEVFKIETGNVVHLAPVTAQMPTETKAGTYTVGPIQFDESGQWIMRFHFNENCSDDPDDSPHGHAAFYLNVP